MIIYTKASEYPCVRAERHGENIHFFDETGRLTVLVDPIVREVVDGEITVVEADEPTQEERIGELEQALDMLLSGVTQ